MAAYEFADGSWWAARLLHDADGPYLIAPLFPRNIDSGGEVELIFTDGSTAASAPVSLTVTPLTPAPGSYDAALDTVRGLISATAAEIGGDDVPTWDELAELTLDSAPPHLTALKFAQMLVGDEVKDAVAAEPAGARALIDAIFGVADVPSIVEQSHIDALLESLPEQIAETGTDADQVDGPAGPVPGPADDGSTAVDDADGTAADVDAGPEAEGAASTAEQPSGFASPRGFATTPPLPARADCIPLGLGGQVSAAKLSQLMIDSAVSEIAIDPRGSAAKIMAVLEGALLVGGALETGATGGAAAFGALGTFTTGLKTVHEARAGTLPSSFTKIQVEVDPDTFDEDHPFEEPGQWTSVKVQAVSTGHGFDQALFDAVTSIGGSLAGGIQEASGVDDATEWLAHADLSDGIYGWDVGKGAAEELAKKLADEQLANGADTFFSCPETWTADIAGADWTWARAQQGLFDVDNEQQSYVNRTAVGGDILAIGPIPARFGQRSIYQYLPVRTEALDVRLGTEEQLARNVIYVNSPGDSVNITAHTRHAYDPQLEWFTTLGSHWADTGDGVTRSSDKVATKRLVTPSRAEDFGPSGIRVEIESTSRSGLRESGDPRRYTFASVRLAPFVVEPDNGTVGIGQQLHYTAVDRNGKAVDAEWRATGGTIRKTGIGTAIYTAGDKRGIYEVVATRGTGPNDTVVVPVEVVEGNCLVGTWQLDSGPFVEQIMAAAGADFPAGSSMSHTGGTYRVTLFPDGTSADHRDEWTLTFDTPEAALFVTMDGVETGTWSTDDDEEDNDPNAGSLHLATTGGAISVKLSSSLGPLPLGSANQFNYDAASADATYTCEADSLEVISTSDGVVFTTNWARVADGEEG